MSISKEYLDAVSAAETKEKLYHIKGTNMLDLGVIRRIDECWLDEDGDPCIHITGKGGNFYYGMDEILDELLVPAKSFSTILREELDEKYHLLPKMPVKPEKPKIVVAGPEDVIISTHNPKYRNNKVQTPSGATLKVADKLYYGQYEGISLFDPKRAEPGNEDGDVWGCVSPFGIDLLLRPYYTTDLKIGDKVKKSNRARTQIIKRYECATWTPKYTADVGYLMPLGGEKYPFIQHLPYNYIVVGKMKDHTK